MELSNDPAHRLHPDTLSPVDNMRTVPIAHTGLSASPHKMLEFGRFRDYQDSGVILCKA
jgi:hypothetical protein